MQDEGVQSTFEKVMADIEDNDDLATREIMKETDAASVKPEPEVEGEKPADQDTKPDEEETEEEKETDAPPPEQDMDRFRKLAKRGRELGSRTHQLQQQETTLQQRHDDLATREEAYQINMQKLSDMMEAFERDPIEAYKMRGADPKVIGQRIKRLLTDKDGVQQSDEVTALREELRQMREEFSTRDQQFQQQQQARAQVEAMEAAHAEMKTYMSDDAAQKAFPLSARLPEALFRQYSTGAVKELMAAKIPLTHDSVLEVIEASLEAMRPVYGDSPTPPPRDAPAQKAATPAGQSKAPSIGNAEKTSGPSGPDWDTLSLGDDEDDFVDKIRKEVASG
jgi:hypothetical protein